MKWILSLASFVLLLIGCKSNEVSANEEYKLDSICEERVLELIRTDLSKALCDVYIAYDIDSYQPIDIKVKKAMSSVYTDSACWQALRTYNTELTLADDILKDATKAKAEMDYWGEPTSYSTRYSDSRYYMYKREYLDAMNRADLFIKASRRSKIKLDTMVSKLDTTKQIGWEVVHNYRFTIHDGVPVTEQNRFVFDMDFSRIIINEDSYHTKSFRKVLESH